MNFNRLLKQWLRRDDILAAAGTHWPTGQSGVPLSGLGPSSSFSYARQPGQSCKVAGGHRQDEAGSHPPDAATDSPGHAADGFSPAEDLPGPLAMLPGQRMALVPGFARRWRTIAPPGRGVASRRPAGDHGRSRRCHGPCQPRVSGAGWSLTNGCGSYPARRSAWPSAWVRSP